MTNKKKNLKQANITQIISGVIILIALNIIGNFIFTRFDLTAEKRFTLSDATKSLLKSVDDVVFFKIYLEGDFPAGFKKLSRETKEMLDEFRAYNKNIQYEFINPSESSDKNIRNGIYQELYSKGLDPTNLQVKTKEGSTQQIIFPGGIVNYKNRDLPLQLLSTQMGTDPESQLNNSSQLLEYNLANVIRKLNNENKKKIAFITGHGELDAYETADIISSLSEYYTVERVFINEQITKLTEHKVIDSTRVRIKNKYDLVIIAKPDSAFSEKDKFIIDQFIMRGGKALWLVDNVFASMDSLNGTDETVAINNSLNLDDMLFKYGVRINYNLIMDLNALPIPIVTGNMGGQPQQTFVPWYYFPLLMPVSAHPVVKNLNAIKTEFISSIDTVGSNDEIKKTVLLTTSKYSRIVNTPAVITLEILRKTPPAQLFNKPFIPVCLLLEGEFSSLYKNRMPTEILSSREIGFVEKSKPNKQIVISDGDIIKNQFNRAKNFPYPLGYDKYTKQRFGNKDFIMNAVDYLCDDNGLILCRTKEITMRLLDKNKVEENRVSIQFANTAIPVALVILFGFIQYFLRKRKYR